MAQLTSQSQFDSLLRIDADTFVNGEPFNIYDNEFYIAAAITEYDGSSLPIEDETYGKVVFLRKRWDTVSVNTIDWGFDDLKTKNCTESDFNWGDGRETDSRSRFYPIKSNMRRDIEIYGSKLKCIDESLDLIGNFDQALASNLMITFIKCDPESGIECKTDEEIEEWLEGKYFLTIVNEKKFVPHKFGDDRIYMHSSSKWY